jgi:hypothetical protein
VGVGEVPGVFGRVVLSLPPQAGMIYNNTTAIAESGARVFKVDPLFVSSPPAMRRNDISTYGACAGRSSASLPTESEPRNPQLPPSRRLHVQSVRRGQGRLTGIRSWSRRKKHVATCHGHVERGMSTTCREPHSGPCLKPTAAFAGRPLASPREVGSPGAAL